MLGLDTQPFDELLNQLKLVYIRELTKSRTENEVLRQNLALKVLEADHDVIAESHAGPSSRTTPRTSPPVQPIKQCAIDCAIETFIQDDSVTDIPEVAQETPKSVTVKDIMGGELALVEIDMPSAGLDSKNGPAPSPSSLQSSVTTPSFSVARAGDNISRQVKSVYYRRKDRLKRIFEVNEAMERKESAKQADIVRTMTTGGHLERLRGKKDKLELFIDACMSSAILLNAVFIGLTVDYNENDDEFNAWQAIDLGFTCIFLLELCTKLFIHGGCRGHYSGPDKYSNMFDSALILVDACQLMMGMLSSFATIKPSVSLFRLARLVRLTRVIRLLRTEAFKDLLSMVEGLANGALTLVWAIAVFLMMVYIFALVCRETLGNNEAEHIRDYFHSVPRSMFTIFRCSFGDCSSKAGVPIPEHITFVYGGGFGLAYCIFIFVMTIGLFNIISAIFVDSTMSAAADLNARKARTRLDDEKRWAGNITTIIKELLAATAENESLRDVNLSEHLDRVIKIEFNRNIIDHVVTHEEKVKKCLAALDIDPNDHNRLSDILDPDHSGTIHMLELVDGLRRLRGEPRRSDVVSVDLMVRSLQERVDEVLERLVKIQMHDPISRCLSTKSPLYGSPQQLTSK